MTNDVMDFLGLQTDNILHMSLEIVDNDYINIDYVDNVIMNIIRSLWSCDGGHNGRKNKSLSEFFNTLIDLVKKDDKLDCLLPTNILLYNGIFSDEDYRNILNEVDTIYIRRILRNIKANNSIHYYFESVCDDEYINFIEILPTFTLYYGHGGLEGKEDVIDFIKDVVLGNFLKIFESKCLGDLGKCLIFRPGINTTKQDIEGFCGDLVFAGDIRGVSTQPNKFSVGAAMFGLEGNKQSFTSTPTYTKDEKHDLESRIKILEDRVESLERKIMALSGNALI